MKKKKQPLTLRDILSLLAQLKAKEDEYPAALLAARRADFLAKAANMQPPDGKGPNNNSQAQSNPSSTSTTPRGSSSIGKSLSGVHTASHTLNTVLYAIVGVITTIILAEVTYLYREEIRDLFLPGNKEVISSATLPAFPQVGETPLPGTASPSPTTTISTLHMLPTDLPIKNTPISGSTPMPLPTKPGNRYGQVTKTPTP